MVGAKLSQVVVPSIDERIARHLLTRILTAGRRPSEPWLRTCIVLRPFHAVTDFSDRYSRRRRPAEELAQRAETARERMASGESTSNDEFWAGSFDARRDSYVKMLEGARYAMFFLGAIPSTGWQPLTAEIEMLVPASTKEESEPWPEVEPYANTLLQALHQVGFDVSLDHDMFASKGRLDILPKLLIDVHSTVRQWAALLYARAQEHIAFQISGFLKGRRKEARIRPWKRHELEAWLDQMTRERELRLTGGTTQSTVPMIKDDGSMKNKSSKDAA